MITGCFPRVRGWGGFHVENPAPYFDPKITKTIQPPNTGKADRERSLLPRVRGEAARIAQSVPTEARLCHEPFPS